MSDRSPPGATGCATPAACAAALLKEPQRLLLALASACSPADRPVCPRRSTLPGLATRRPTSTSARIVAYHKDQSSRGRAGAKPVGAGCVRGPIVAAEHPPPLLMPPRRKSPHAMCDVVWSCGRALQCFVHGLRPRCDGRELHAWMCACQKCCVGSTLIWVRRRGGFCCACDAARPGATCGSGARKIGIQRGARPSGALF